MDVPHLYPYEPPSTVLQTWKPGALMSVPDP